MEIVDTFSYICHGVTQGAVEILQRLLKDRLRIYRLYGSKLQDGAGQGVSHIVVYLSCNAVSLFKGCHVYHVILIFHEHTIVLLLYHVLLRLVVVKYLKLFLKLQVLSVPMLQMDSQCHKKGYRHRGKY